jgi:hypothetical protein
MTQHPPFLRTIVCLSLAKSALLVVEAPPQHAFALDRNTATRNAQVTHMTWSIVGTHAKRRGAPPDMHCFACETRFGPDDKLHLAGIISRKNKCGCDDCHADAAPGTLFVAAYCRKAACRRPEIFQAWVDRVTSPHVRADEDQIARLRICGWCARGQFARTPAGEPIAPAPGEDKLRLCIGCRRTYFCGAECESKAWPTHRVTCKAV